MREGLRIGERQSMKALVRPSLGECIRFGGLARLRHLRAGRLLSEKVFHNLVVNTGLNFLLTNDMESASLFLGLTEASPTFAATDTMASTPGWNEAAGYDEATRPAWGHTLAATVLGNFGTPATFTMNGADTSIGGFFLTSDNTKDGTTGTLICGAARSGGNLTGIVDNDVIELEYSITAADDGV